MKHKLFTYGTLQKGFLYHEYLKDAKYLGKHKTNGGFSMYVSVLPYLVKENNEQSVHGELYEVTLKDLAHIDILEGHPHHYKREIINVYDEDGNSVEAWAYLYPNIFKREEFKDAKRTKYGTGE